MKNKTKKRLSIMWLTITILAVLSMIIFMFIPLIGY